MIDQFFVLKLIVLLNNHFNEIVSTIFNSPYLQRWQCPTHNGTIDNGTKTKLSRVSLWIGHWGDTYMQHRFSLLPLHVHFSTVKYLLLTLVFRSNWQNSQQFKLESVRPLNRILVSFCRHFLLIHDQITQKSINGYTKIRILKNSSPFWFFALLIGYSSL